MKTNLIWTLLGVMTALILMLVYFNFFHQKTEKIEVREERIEVQYQHDHAYADYASLERRIVSLENKVLNLEKQKEQQVTRPVTQTTPRTRTAPVTPTPTPAPPPKPEPEPSRAPDRKADLSHIKNVHGQILFCVMANNDGGMHFPQYALERGVKFNGIQSNTTADGNNWIVNPTEEIRGDYGVTYSGTFFVSHEVIQATMAMPLVNLGIKAGFTSWNTKEMTKENGYWIYKTR